MTRKDKEKDEELLQAIEDGFTLSEFAKRKNNTQSTISKRLSRIFHGNIPPEVKLRIQQNAAKVQSLVSSVSWEDQEGRQKRLQMAKVRNKVPEVREKRRSSALKRSDRQQVLERFKKGPAARWARKERKPLPRSKS